MEKVDVGPPDYAVAEEAGVGVAIAAGPTVPSSGALGFAPSCLYVDTDATDYSSRVYVNHGTRTSANFQSLVNMSGPVYISASSGAPSTTNALKLSALVATASVDAIGTMTTLDMKIAGTSKLAVTSTAVTAGASVVGNFNAAGLRTIQAVTNVNDTTPTAAELTTAFGNPATIGRGFVGTIDDADGDTNGYLVWASDASYYFLKGTKAT